MPLMNVLSLAPWILAAAGSPGLADGSGPRPDPTAPLSSLVAVNALGDTDTVPGLTVGLAEAYRLGTVPDGVEFPLQNVLREDVRSLRGTAHQVVVRWLDPITPADGVLAPRFGANCDYVAYFGDGWDADWEDDVVGRAPQYAGSGSAAHLWVNHEQISNRVPRIRSAPTGQHLTYAKFLADGGYLTNAVEENVWSQDDIDRYVAAHKTQLGGSWIRIEKDARSGEWSLVRQDGNRRYDATSGTRLRLTGHTLSPTQAPVTDHDDEGNALPAGVLAGITANCSGAQTPWGTVISAEENVQFYYGDLETAWTSQQRFVTGNGFDPGSNISPVYTASTSADFGLVGNIVGRHNRDAYGFLTEIDPRAAPSSPYRSVADGGDGSGHRKIGSMGRARWENATIATGADWALVDGAPLVLYGGDDRRSGRVYKWVSDGAYESGMTRGQVRALLDDGTLYVAHFAGLDNATGKTLLSSGLPPTEDAPGVGQWLELSVTSTDTPPNAAALGRPDITIGEALQDVDYNGIGGFPTDDLVRVALFTASNKLGVMELNRPEDIEWNPLDPSGTPRLYVAFTMHRRRVALDQEGVLYDPDAHHARSPVRSDVAGAIFAMQEADPAHPAASATFEYFQAWGGTEGDGVFDAANPDNIAIDSEGRVWFGTDGNVGTNGGADGVYYLDLDPAGREGQPGVVNPTHGLAFRVAQTPSDAEATGPCFSADERTLFFAVQHPGENTTAFPTRWPQ